MTPDVATAFLSGCGSAATGILPQQKRVSRMFAMIDLNGSLWRGIETKEAT